MFVPRLTRRVPLVEQELPTIPEHLSTLPVFCAGFVFLDLLILCVCFVDRCLYVYKTIIHPNKCGFVDSSVS